MIENFSEYTRDNGTRIYRKNDKNYISLTTLLSRYENKTHLENWRERIGHDEAKRIGTAAANRGKLAHSQIEHFYGLSECSQFEYNKYADTAIKGFYSYVEPINVEQVVFYEHPSGARVAGRYDALLYIPEGVFRYKDSDDLVIGGNVIVDLKTKDKTPRFDKLDFIFKNLLQISAYSKILSLTTDYNVQGAVAVYAVVLKTKEHCKIIYLDSSRIDFFWNLTIDILLDFYKIKPLQRTWEDMIALTHCSFDKENEILIDHCPREIYVNASPVSDFGLLENSGDIWAN